MGEYLSPGVYVEEMAGPRPIEGASTSTAAFVGYTAKGEVGKAQFVTSFGEYERYFGGFQVHEDVRTPFAVKNFFDEGGSKAYVVRHGANTLGEKADGSSANGLSIRAKAGIFSSDKYVVEMSKGTSISDGEFTLKFKKDISTTNTPAYLYIGAITGVTKQKLKNDSSSLLGNAYVCHPDGRINYNAKIDLTQLFEVTSISNTMNIPDGDSAHNFEIAVVPTEVIIKAPYSSTLEECGIYVSSTVDNKYSIVVTPVDPTTKKIQVEGPEGLIGTAQDIKLGTSLTAAPLEIAGAVSLTGLVTSLPTVSTTPLAINIVKDGEKVENELSNYGITATVDAGFDEDTNNCRLEISKPGESYTFELITESSNISLTTVVPSTDLSVLSIPGELTVTSNMNKLPDSSGIRSYGVHQRVPGGKTSPELALWGLDVLVSEQLSNPYQIDIRVAGADTFIELKDGSGTVINFVKNPVSGTSLSQFTIAGIFEVSGAIFDASALVAGTNVSEATLNSYGISTSYVDIRNDVALSISSSIAGTYTITNTNTSSNATISATDFSTLTGLPTGLALSGILSAIPAEADTVDQYDLTDEDTRILLRQKFGFDANVTSGSHTLDIVLNNDNTTDFIINKDETSKVTFSNLGISVNLTDLNETGITVSADALAIPDLTKATYPVTAVKAIAATAKVGGGATASFTVEAVSDGVWANDVTVSVVSTGSVDSNGSQLFTLVVAEKGIEVETFEDVTLDANNKKAFITTVVEENSNYIRITDVEDTNEVAVGTFKLSNGSPETGFDNTITIGDLEKYLDDIDGISMLITPDEKTAAAQKDGAAYCDKRKDCFFIASTSESDIKKLQDYKTDLGGMSRCALYAPYLKQLHPLTGEMVKVPAAGAVAGIYARTDVNRGVFKAPAGTIDGQVRTALALSHPFSKGEQDMLNPLGINLIRKFPGAGNLIWGTRTTAADAQWRYVPVRRLVMYIEKSIENSIQWSVFEPNDQKLWSQLKREISGFLRGVWKDGGLFGASEDQAFFVKIDEENNPQSSRDAGKLIVNIGVAPVKPAEFVILRIEQTQSEA